MVIVVMSIFVKSFSACWLRLRPTISLVLVVRCWRGSRDERLADG